MARQGLPRAIIKKYGITKKAWKVYRGGSRTSRTRRSSPPSRRKGVGRLVRRYRRRYRRRKRRRRASRTIPIIPLIGTLGPAVVAGKQAWDSGWGIEGVLDQISQIYTGFSFVNNTWDAEQLKRGLLPAIVSIGAHKILNMLGVNRVFSKLPSPLNKLRL